MPDKTVGQREALLYHVYHIMKCLHMHFLLLYKSSANAKWLLTLPLYESLNLSYVSYLQYLVKLPCSFSFLRLSHRDSNMLQSLKSECGTSLPPTSPITAESNTKHHQSLPVISACYRAHWIHQSI